MTTTALTADDLLAPKGKLELDWFAPLNSLAVNARLNEWLKTGFDRSSESAAQSTRDDTAQAFAYYSAYEHIASALARKPKSFTVSEQNDTTTRTYSAEDYKFFKGMADSWYDVFVSLLPEDVPVADVTPSMSVKNRFRF